MSDPDVARFHWLDLASFGLLLTFAVLLLHRAIPPVLAFAFEMLRP